MATTSYVVSPLLPPDFPPLNSAMNTVANVIFVNYCYHCVMPLGLKPQGVAFLWNVLPLFSVSGMFFLFFLCNQVLSIFQGTSPTSPRSLLLTSPGCHCHFNYVFSSVNAFTFPSCFVSSWILRKAILFGISQFA